MLLVGNEPRIRAHAHSQSQYFVSLLEMAGSLPSLPTWTILGGQGEQCVGGGGHKSSISVVYHPQDLPWDTSWGN